jgi:hypothetical protein
MTWTAHTYGWTTILPKQTYWSFFDIPPTNGHTKSIRCINKEGKPVDLMVGWLGDKPTYVRISYHTESRPVFVGQIDVSKGKIYETPSSVLSQTKWHSIAERILKMWREDRLSYEVIE